MRRFSIFGAMALVALAAVNFAVIRWRLVHDAGDASSVFLIGLLPLLDAQIIGVYCLITSRYRISLKRRMPEERIGCAPVFAAFNGLLLIIAIAACVWTPDGVTAYLADLSQLLEPLLRYFEPATQSGEVPPAVYLIELVLLCGVMSGPPLLLSLAASAVLHRYKVVIVRRRPPPEPVDDSEASQSDAAARVT